jgi:hypothetical protein
MKSLHDSAVEAVGNFLYEIHFPKLSDEFPLLLVDALNTMSNYKEEGVLLFPEVIVTTDIETLISPIPSRLKLDISSGITSEFSLKDALKITAPHCVDGWVIYVEISTTKFTFGLVNSEISELSQTVRNHILSNEIDVAVPFFYMRRVGNNLLRLESKKDKWLVISSGLSKPLSIDNNDLKKFAVHCVKDTAENIKPILLPYLEKILAETMQKGHGNLVAIVKSNSEAIKTLKDNLPDGKYLPVPLNLFKSNIEIENEIVSPEEINQQSARRIKSLYSTMMNQDGITVISSKGELICFNLFVKPSNAQEVTGGARSRAFETMKASNYFDACFFKSQDGNERLWEKLNDN